MYAGDEQKINDALDALAGPFNDTVDKVLEAVASIEKGADLASVRKGLGIRYAGDTYTVPKYAVRF